MVRSDIVRLPLSTAATQDKSFWMIFSTALLAVTRSALRPSLSLKPSVFCSVTRLSKLDLRSRTVIRSGMMMSWRAAPSVVSMRSRQVIACAWPSLKFLTSASEGCATKSLVAARIANRPALRSRLASATSVLRCTVLKALSTAVSPVRKAMPFARKPTTGMTPSTTMRARTDSREKILAKNIEYPLQRHCSGESPTRRGNPPPAHSKLVNIWQETGGFDPHVPTLPSSYGGEGCAGLFSPAPGGGAEDGWLAR